jgi:hypothetical protein
MLSWILCMCMHQLSPLGTKIDIVNALLAIPSKGEAPYRSAKAGSFLVESVVAGALHV